MKKTVATLIAAVGLLYCSISKGQTTFGLKAGVNIANISDNPYEPRIGFHGGLFINKMLSKYIAVQPELLFSGEGQKIMYNGAEHSWVLNYLQLPLMLQVYPVKQFYIEGGPQVGLLISAKDKVTGGHSDIKSSVADAVFSMGVGLGLKATEQVIIYGRYNFGFTDISTFDVLEHHSNVGQIGIAIRFKQ